MARSLPVQPPVNSPANGLRTILLAWVAVSLLTSACGNKGPLYLPGESAPPVETGEAGENGEDADLEERD